MLRKSRNAAHFIGGRERTGVDFSGVQSKPVFGMYAENIKHMLCRERTSLVQGMLEVPEGGDV